MTAPRPLDHMATIAGDYDLYLLDQWGVLHDGENAHPGAIEVMANLKAQGATIILVSNSSKRIPVSVERLDQLGIGEALYDHILTSGELAWQALKDRTDPFYDGLGRNCILITAGANMAFVTDHGLNPVEDVAEADFIFTADLPAGPIEELEPMLREAAQRGLPMLLLNPDYMSIEPDGSMHDCPGAVGRAYEAVGGTIKFHGKPAASVYEKCFELAPAGARAVAVGDSLLHDIKGAVDAGIDSVFVTSGIHAYELGAKPDQPADAERVAEVAAEYGSVPTYFATRMVW